MAKIKKGIDQLASLNSLGRISQEGLRQVSHITSQTQQNNQISEKKDEITKQESVQNNSVSNQPVEQQNQIMPDEKTLEKEKESSQKYHEFLEVKRKEIVNLKVSELDDAPSTLNFFPPLTETKALFLKFSIQNSGLFDPIIVWEKKNGRYMILSGHNRVKAFRELMRESDDDEYIYIPGIVYGADEIDEEKAKEIIIDTNFIQRGDFSPKLRGEIVKARMDLYQNQRDSKGRRINEIAQELNIKKTTIYEDMQIIENVIPEIRELYFNGTISRAAVLRVPYLYKELQEMIYQDYPTLIDNKHLRKIEKGMMEQDVRNLFEEDTNKIINDLTVRVKIPENHYDEFMQMYNQFMTEIEKSK